MKLIQKFFIAMICTMGSFPLLAVYNLTVYNKHNKKYKIRAFFHSTGVGDKLFEVNPGEVVTIDGGKTLFFSSCYDRIEATVLVPQANGTWRDGATFVYNIGINQCTDHKIAIWSSDSITIVDEGKILTDPGQVGMGYDKNSKVITLDQAETPGRYDF